jgi:multidrug resistance efflux pump
MIKSIRKRTRPDNLKNQVRAGGQSFARRLYFYCIVALFTVLGWTFTGHWFFLDAEGIVTKERTIIAPDYSARVMSIHTKPGDTVKAGQHIATLQSREILDSIAELSSRRATISSREAQIIGRIETIQHVLPGARERRQKAEGSRAKINALAAQQLTTSIRIQEVQKEFYEAQREESSLSNELRALNSEFKNIAASVIELDEAIKQVTRTYNNGKVLAQVDGTVGPKVPHLGQIVKSGEPLIEVWRGDMFVLAYLPVGRLYSILPGDAVRVSDGQSVYPGKVERIENVTDNLPPELQHTFRTADRQQLFRIGFPEQPVFAIQSKIKLSSTWSPQGIMAKGKGMILAAGETISSKLRFGNNETASH